MRAQIDVLLDEYTDAQVAHVLNERGFQTGAGDPFDAVSVQWVRFSAKLPSLKLRLLAAGMITTKQLTEKTGAPRTTISRWRTKGLIQARMCAESGEWLYWLPVQIPPYRGAPKRQPVGTSTARGAL